MSQFIAIMKKELRQYFNSPIAYIFLVAFLSFTTWFFFRFFFLQGFVSMRSFFEILPWIFLFLIPSLTMRLWSEEYRQGTIETLLTSSVSVTAAVISKFLASVIFLIISLLATSMLVFSISTLGSLDFGVVISAYIGALLLGMSYIAIGVFISSITHNQIVAFIVSVFTCLGFFLIGSQLVTFALPGFLVPYFEFIGLGTHYDSIIRGVIDSRDIIFYMSFISLFLFMNIQLLTVRKK